MAHDQQTYRRGANAALVGLGIQFLVVVAVGITGLSTNSPAVQAATWHVIGGLPIWIVLFLVFNQHRLERVEALEAERLAKADAQTAAFFEEHALNLDVARKRLERLYSWGLRIASVLVSLYLLTTGGIMLYNGIGAFQSGALSEQATGVSSAVPAALMLAVTVIAFIAARYHAGMTKIAEWQLLRGGSAYFVGSAISALLCSVGLFAVTLQGGGGLLALAAVIVPALMVLLGLEILLVFLLSVYRPRRPGEAIRPAFDSRLLGMLTSPTSLARAVSDAINYQFGFEVSRSWFYQLLSKAVAPLVALGVAVLVLMSCFVVVEPHEEAIKLHFGAIVDINGDAPGAGTLGPGTHLKLPWPIQSIEARPVQRINELIITSAGETPARGADRLWGGVDDSEDVTYFLTAAAKVATTTNADEDAESSVTSVSLMKGDVSVLWRPRSEGLPNYISVSDRAGTIRSLLTAMAEEAVRGYFLTQDIDEIIGPGSDRIGAAVQRRLQQQFDDLGLGVEIIYVGVTNAQPPNKGQVVEAYDEHLSATQQSVSTVQRARQEATETLAEVAGSRDQALLISAAIDEYLEARTSLEALRQAVRSEDAERIDAAMAPLSEELRSLSPAEALDQLEQAVARTEGKVEQELAEAQGRAAELIHEARAARWEREMLERGKAERFAAELAGYQQAPEHYKVRRYLQVLAEAMRDRRKVILTSTPENDPSFQLDLKEATSAMDAIWRDQFAE